MTPDPCAATDSGRSDEGTAQVPGQPHALDARGDTLSPGPSNAASWAIAAIAFLIVTGETLPVGLLGDVAAGVDARPSDIGLVVSWYALIAAGTALPVTRLARRYDRRRIIVSCAVAVAAAHVASALATDVAALMASRALAAVSHGLYFAVAGPAVMRLATDEARARAGGRIMVAASSALVVGTPVGTVVGQVAGWRSAMLLVAALALALSVVTARLMPPMPPHDAGSAPSESSVLSVLRSPALVLLFVVTVVGVAAHFVLWTYISPFAERFGVHDRGLGALLLAYGTASVTGSVLGTRMVDRRPVAAMRGATLVFVAAILGLWASDRWDVLAAGVVAALVWGGAFSMIAVSTGLAVLRRSAGPRAETANALHGIVFQLGIVGGSALGAVAYDQGRLGELPLVTAAGGALALALTAGARGTRAYRHGLG